MKMLISILFAVSLCGCGTIAGRGDADLYPCIYPGVRTDFGALDYKANGDHLPISMIGIFDWPFSGAIDTALLPIDLSYWAISAALKTNSPPRNPKNSSGFSN
jgi:uncharacterized protein YceK